MGRDKIDSTKEEIVLEWLNSNYPCSWQDLIAQFGYSEMYCKSVINRIKNGHIKLIKIEE